MRLAGDQPTVDGTRRRLLSRVGHECGGSAGDRIGEGYRLCLEHNEDSGGPPGWEEQQRRIRLHLEVRRCPAAAVRRARNSSAIEDRPVSRTLPIERRRPLAKGEAVTLGTIRMLWRRRSLRAERSSRQGAEQHDTATPYEAHSTIHVPPLPNKPRVRILWQPAAGSWHPAPGTRHLRYRAPPIRNFQSSRYAGVPSARRGVTAFPTLLG